MLYNQKKQRQRETLIALYGLDSEQERFINAKKHKIKIIICSFFLLITTIITIIGNFYCVDIDSKGYALAIGTKVDNSRFVGILNIKQIEENIQMYPDIPPEYQYLNVVDFIIVGCLVVTTIYIIVLIILGDMISNSLKQISAYNEYLRRQKLLKSEQSTSNIAKMDNIHKYAPKYDVNEENYENK